MTDSSNWLNDEIFDFEIDSPTTTKSHDKSGDDEVFIGPLTHKERCVAFAVNELVEEAQASLRFDRIKPEEQAMLLQESTLVALKIKEKDLSVCTTPRRRKVIHHTVDVARMKCKIQNLSFKPDVEEEKIMNLSTDAPTKKKVEDMTKIHLQPQTQSQQSQPHPQPQSQVDETIKRKRKSLRRSGLPVLRRSVGCAEIKGVNSPRKKLARRSIVPTTLQRKVDVAKPRRSLLPMKNVIGSRSDRRKSVQLLSRKTPQNRDKSKATNLSENRNPTSSTNRESLLAKRRTSLTTSTRRRLAEVSK